MSKAQHFKTMTTETPPYASVLSGNLDSGWEVVSIVNSARGGFITYFKRIKQKEAE